VAIFLIILETARGQVNIILAVVPEDLLLMLVCIVDCNYIDQVPLGGCGCVEAEFYVQIGIIQHCSFVCCLMLGACTKCSLFNIR